jgi:hypothetical protein
MISSISGLTQEASTFPSTFRPAQPKGPTTQLPNHPPTNQPTQSFCTVVTLSHSKEVRKKKQKPEGVGRRSVACHFPEFRKQSSRNRKPTSKTKFEIIKKEFCEHD